MNPGFLLYFVPLSLAIYKYSKLLHTINIANGIDLYLHRRKDQADSSELSSHDRKGKARDTSAGIDDVRKEKGIQAAAPWTKLENTGKPCGTQIEYAYSA